MGEVPSIPAESIKEQLERISRSREFAKSPQMCRFLRFTVDGVLSGRESELKEYTIAIEVFNRPADFNQRADPVVRNEARRLRKKLHLYYSDEGVADPVLIELPIGGYVPKIRERTLGEEGSAAEPVGEQPEQLLHPADVGGNSRVSARDSIGWRSAGIAFCLVLVLTPLGFWLANRRHSRPGGTKLHSIAVLGFRNLTSDPGMNVLSDGIADEVLNSLARVPDLKVVAWSSSAQFKDVNISIEEIGQKLGVEAVLEGTVRASDGKLRITPRLIDARNEYQLWSQRYEFQTKNLFEIQDSIARSVTHFLGYDLNAPAPQPSRDDEAYRTYILGKQYVVEYQERIAPLERGISTLERAIALDPGNADAYASLAITYGLGVDLGVIPAAEGVEKALRYGRKALELNPNSPLALASKGAATAALHRDWQAADPLFRRAIELKPSDAQIRNMYAFLVLLPTRRLEDAQRQMAKAVELDPMNAVTHIQRAYTLYLGHQYEAAIRAGEKAISLSPNSDVIATILLRFLVLAGRPDSITALMDRYWKTEPMHSYAVVMEAYAKGDFASARRYARTVLRNPKCPDCQCDLSTILNDETSLVRAFDNIPFPADIEVIPQLLFDPFYDKYRSTPAFQATIKHMLAVR